MLVLTLLFVLLAEMNAEFTFLSVGDWGGSAVTESDEFAKNAKQVSSAMAAAAAASDAAFVLNTGDNFYWCGIQNTSDYQVDVDFLNVYDQPSLQIPWYGSLGNHEYGYSVESQLQLQHDRSDMSHWILPERYYTRRIQLGKRSSSFMSLIVIDTSPCISQYRSSNSENWDPCGPEWPTCSLNSSDDDFEGECMFHQNIMSQNCQEQYDWFTNTLKEAAAQYPNDWLVVVGHHPADEIDEEDFIAPMQDAGVDLYLNGHVHAMEQYIIDGAGVYITTGAGSMAESLDQKSSLMLAKKGQAGAAAVAAARAPTYSSTHDYEQLFLTRLSGFTKHTLSQDRQTLVTQFIAANGTVLREVSQQRGANRSLKSGVPSE